MKLVYKIIALIFWLFLPIWVGLIYTKIGLSSENSIRYAEIQSAMITAMALGYSISLFSILVWWRKKGIWIAPIVMVIPCLLAYLMLPSRYHCYGSEEYVGAPVLVNCE
jgi:hypothetical protein